MRIDAAAEIERMGALYGAEPVQALRVPPSSVQAEAAVLGGLMLSPKTLPVAQDLLAPEDFYRADHQAIYRAILALSDARKPFDAVTVMDWFEANGGGCEPGYLIELATTTPSAANVKAYAQIVADKALLRRMIDAGEAIVGDGYAPGGRETADILADAQAAIVAMQPKQRGGLRSARDSLTEWLEERQRRYQSGTRMTGMPTPWHAVNEHTRGLQNGQLTLLAARPSMGKSIAGLNLALFNSLRQKRVALFSLEMNFQQILNRNVSSLSGVPHEWVDSPHDGGEEEYWDRMYRAVDKVRNDYLLIDDTADLTIGQVMARARTQHMQAPLDLVVVDHIHDFKIKVDQARFEYGRIAQGLKTLAKEFNCPVVGLAQLNRNVNQRSDKRPNMADLRESGELEQKGDLILFLHREDYYDKETHLKGVVELIVAKGRDIEAGKTIYLQNDYAHMALRDWDGAIPQAPSMAKKKTDRWGPQA